MPYPTSTSSPARVFHFPNNFGPEQSSFIMWHHFSRYDPRKIQSRLKKTFPGLYPIDTDLISAIQGHIRMLESNWAPKDWLNMDLTKVSWGWMLLVKNEDMILEGGIRRGNPDVQGGDIVLDAGGGAEVYDEEKYSKDEYEGPYDGSGQHSDAQANSGEDNSIRDGNYSSGDGSGPPKIESLIDISETDPKSNEDEIPAYIEVHLEELMDCFTPTNTNR